MNTAKLPTQKNRILEALKTGPVPMWKMIAPRSMGGLSIGQYNARVLELRREGYDIQNKTDENGYTYFTLETRNLVQQLQEEHEYEHRGEPKQLGLSL